jgi:hypothetical protein
MSGFEPVEQATEDFRIEITDLGKPIFPGGTISSWFVNRLLIWQRPENWRRFRLTSILCLPLIFVLIILLGIGNGLSILISNTLYSDINPHQIVSPPNSLKLFPGSTSPKYNQIHQQDGIACLVDAQWSPDSKSIAILGYQHDCPEGNELPGILNFYNASNSKLVAQWQIDDTILNILKPPTISSEKAVSSFGATQPRRVNDGEGRLIGFNYSSILWSPDGHRLAVSFTTSMKQQRMHGILLIDVNGQHTQLLLQTQNNAHELPIEWDLQSRMALPLKAIQLALQYRWGNNGALLPVIKLSNDSAPLVGTTASVGNPDGESSFTIWQPGYAALTNISGLPVWNTNFGAWSPDGRYLIESITQSGLMETQNQPELDAQAQEYLREANMPLMPAHDIALLRVATTSSVIAWRSDGRILADFNYYDAVNLYDCVTGNEIASLHLPFRDQSLAGSAALLRWSPNGTNLLLSSASGGVISLWRSVQLPH